MRVGALRIYLWVLLFPSILWSNPALLSPAHCNTRLRNSTPASHSRDRAFTSDSSSEVKRNRSEPGQEFRLSPEGETAAQADYLKAKAEYTRTAKAKVDAQIKAEAEIAKAKAQLQLAEADLAKATPANKQRLEAEVAQASEALKKAEDLKRTADKMKVSPGYQPKPTLTGKAATAYVKARLKGKTIESVRHQAEQIRSEIAKPLSELDTKYTEYLVQEAVVKDMADGPAKKAALQAQAKLRAEIESQYDAILPKTKELSDALLDEQLLKLVSKTNIEDSFEVFDGADIARMNESIHSKGEFFPDRPVFRFQVSNGVDVEPPIFVRGTGDTGNPAGDYYIPEVSFFESGATMQRFSATPDGNNYTKYWRVQFNKGDQFLIGSCGDLRPDFSRSLDVIVPETIDPRRKDFVYTARVPMIGGAVQIKRPNAAYFPEFANQISLNGSNFVGMSAGLDGRALEPHMQAVRAKKRGQFDEANYKLAMKYTQEAADKAQQKVAQLKSQLAGFVPDQNNAFQNAKIKHDIEVAEREVAGYASRIHFLNMEIESVRAPDKFAEHYAPDREAKIQKELQVLAASKAGKSADQILRIEQQEAGRRAELEDLKKMSARERDFLYQYYSAEAGDKYERDRGYSTWE